jgi:hypothetical protein
VHSHAALPDKRQKKTDPEEPRKKQLCQQIILVNSIFGIKQVNDAHIVDC